jgi:hypothetical protein
MNDLQQKMNEAVANIQRNHHQIIDDWCKAYMAELYEKGVKLNPGCFILNQQQVNEEGKIGWKYWFSIKEEEKHDAST